jgi:hypothetical protein
MKIRDTSSLYPIKKNLDPERREKSYTLPNGNFQTQKIEGVCTGKVKDLSDP